ncbi:MAG: ATP-binding protein [Deltaproteobacteria bacterium]|nr:ATP-binding protein [Deltaproteobacteria bacterium]
MGFFLGKDLETGERIDYVPKHLTTHGLIFGMTGSGKTGLALALLEEAQRAKIPVIAIDPKGDLGNLALAWPDLSPVDFATWIDPSKLDGRSPLDVAEQTANTWRDGLAKDGLAGSDIGAMRAGSAVTIYTPGSTSGVPVSLLDRFEPPPAFAELAEEDRSELIGGLVAALLALVKIDADPLQSKEYIFLSNVLSDAWSRGETLDLPRLVQRITTPPFSRLGVFELDEFFPPKKRKDFAMQLNGLLASPSFQAWMQGVPLDVGRLFAKEPNGVRTSIFSIAHLDDSERMSFVTLLLDRVVGWMRAQPGTGELRAILYMDEVFGYLPPHPGNPPSKRPLLTLLKQARAFGLGVMLATQNPVDIDYKALTNAGTWMVGKLQTDQDKERILDGLMGAQTATVPVSRSDISRRISSLESRQFLLQNANDAKQRVLKSRFCMSYLRGPLTRQEIGRLKAKGFYNAPEVAGLSPRVEAPSTPSASPPPTAPSVSVGSPASDEVVGEVVEIGASSHGGWGAPSSSWTPSAAPSAPVPRPSPPSVPWSDASSPVSNVPRGLEVRTLNATALMRPEVVQALGWSGVPAQGPQTLMPALFAEAALNFTIDGVGEVSSGTVSRLAFPMPMGPGALAWKVVDGVLTTRDLVGASLPGWVEAPLPGWLSSPADRERAKDRLIQDLIGSRSAVVPVCVPLGKIGVPGETLEAFRARLAKPLGQAADGALGKATGARDQQASLIDKQLADFEQLLAMDRNEIVLLKQGGDAQALSRAKDRARFRMEKYKELKATRDKFVGLAEREMADIEFSALDKLAACELREVRLNPRGVRIGYFGLLWIPSRT